MFNLIATLAFVLVTTFMPGPNNTLSLVSGKNNGYKNSFKFFFGGYLQDLERRNTAPNPVANYFAVILIFLGFSLSLIPRATVTIPFFTDASILSLSIVSSRVKMC